MNFNYTSLDRPADSVRTSLASYRVPEGQEIDVENHQRSTSEVFAPSPSRCNGKCKKCQCKECDHSRFFSIDCLPSKQAAKALAADSYVIRALVDAGRLTRFKGQGRARGISRKSFKTFLLSPNKESWMRKARIDARRYVQTRIPPPGHISIEDFALKVNRSYAMIRKLVLSGDIPHVVHKRWRYIPLAEIKKYLETRETALRDIHYCQHEAVSKLGVSRYTFYDLIKRGVIKQDAKFGNSALYLKGQIDSIVVPKKKGGRKGNKFWDL